MHSVGLVWVDCIMMIVDWFVFFLYCSHDLPIPAGITIWVNYANEKRLSQHIWLVWCGPLRCTYRDSQCDWLVKIRDIVNAPDWFDWINSMRFSKRFYRCDLCFPEELFFTPMVEYVLCLTYFCKVWYEWYGLNIMWWSVCNKFCDQRVTCQHNRVEVVPFLYNGLRVDMWCLFSPCNLLY